MPATTNWLVWNGTESTRYNYTTTGNGWYFPQLLASSSTTIGSMARTYSLSGTILNSLSWTMDLNPGYDAPYYEADYYQAGRATDQQIRAAIVGHHLDVGHATPAQVRQVSERERSRTTATERARGLLLGLLTEEQRASYERDGYFEVLGSAGGLYRINHGTAGNVEWIDPATGRAGARLCAHPSTEHGWLPEPDVAVAQLLALQTDEAEFVRVANVHAGRRPVIQAPSRLARILRVA